MQTPTGPLSVLTEEVTQWAANRITAMVNTTDPTFASCLETARQNAKGVSTTRSFTPNVQFTRKLNVTLDDNTLSRLGALEDGGIIQDYFLAIVDTVALVFEIAGFYDIGSDTDVSVNVQTEEMSLLRKTINKFVEAFTDYHYKGDAGSVVEMAKAIWKLFGALWNTIGKAIFDACAASMSWEEWLEVAVIALGTLLAWLATDGLALIGEMILLITNTVITFEAWITAIAAGSPEQFIEALIGNGGTLSDQVIINQLYNPSVVAVGGYTYIFTNSMSLSGALKQSADPSDQPGIVFSYAQSQDLYTVIAQHEAIQTADNTTIQNQFTSQTLPAYFNKFELVRGSNENVSSPSAVALGNTLFVFFKVAGTRIQYCLCTNADDPENANWEGPFIVPPTVNTQTAPCATVYQDKIYLFYQGSGEQHIWYDIFDGGNWTGITEIPQASTSTTPAVNVIEDCMFLTYKDVVNNFVHLFVFCDNFWYYNETFSTWVNTEATPKLVVQSDGLIRLYYSGLGDSPAIFSHPFSLAQEIQQKLSISIDAMLNAVLASAQIDTNYNTGVGVSTSSPVFLESPQGNIMFYSEGPGAMGFMLVPRQDDATR